VIPDVAVALGLAFARGGALLVSDTCQRDWRAARRRDRWDGAVYVDDSSGVIYRLAPGSRTRVRLFAP
jgi:hypothetical protein